jgi:ubiquinone/menaquinone biosynthesis C-methylase UbiE
MDPFGAAACCARFYEQDWVRAVLGDSFHPGGLELSGRLIRNLYLPPGARALEVACGIGRTTRLMAGEFRLDTVGLDVSEPNLAKAREWCATQPLPVEFVCGSAENLPFPDESFDAVVCECAISTFSDQRPALAEFARVVKPGGVIGISDMVVEGEIPDDIAGLLAPWTCLSGARSAIGYQSLFLAAGLRVTGYADETNGLRDLVVDLKRKLLTAALARFLGAVPGLEGLAVPQLRDLLRRVSALIDEGVIQYARLTFAKGRPRFTPSVTPQARSDTALPFVCDPSPGCCESESPCE